MLPGTGNDIILNLKIFEDEIGPGARARIQFGAMRGKAGAAGRV